MSSILRIQFHEDFQKRYDAYKTKLLGSNVIMHPTESNIGHSEKNAPIEKAVSIDTTRGSITPGTETNANIGYLLFHGETIRIGKSDTGKFKLVELLCRNFGKAMTVDVVFGCVRKGNKTDTSFESEYTGPTRKIDLIKNQVKEINRIITDHAKTNNLKKFKHRLALKADHTSNNKTVWLVEKSVG